MLTQAITAITSAAGALGGGILGWLGQKDANEANALEAQKNRDFQHAESQEQMAYQTRMSNSAYQRATEDMRAAGINPMLAFSQGGASTPAGQAGSGAQATAGNAGEKLGAGIESAAKLGIIAKDLEAKDADIKLMKNQAAAARANEQLADTTQSGVVTDNAMKTLEYVQKNANINSATKAEREENDLRTIRAKINKTMAIPDAVGERLGPVLKGLSSAQAIRRGGTPPPPPSNFYQHESRLRNSPAYRNSLRR